MKHSMAVSRLVLGVLIFALSAAQSVNVAGAQRGSDEDQIRQVVTDFNAAAEKATSSGDPTVEQRYTSAAYYPQVAQDLQDDWDQGVVATRLINIEWGPIVVNGDRATAETTETWAITLDDGRSGAFPPERNVYRLVRENGVWKVDADDHPDTIPDLPMT